MILSELIQTLGEKIAKFGDFRIDHINIGDNDLAEIWIVTEDKTGTNPILIDQMFSY